ncbi:cytosolic carboxypeptidase 1-like X4, partial [Biomphalaria pfeifferi]
SAEENAKDNKGIACYFRAEGNLLPSPNLPQDKWDGIGQSQNPGSSRSSNDRLTRKRMTRRRSAGTETVVEPAITEVEHNTSLDSKDFALFCRNESNTNIYQSAEENAKDNKGDLQILKQLLSLHLQKLNIIHHLIKYLALFCRNESNTNIYQTLIHNTKSAEENAKDNKEQKVIYFLVQTSCKTSGMASGKVLSSSLLRRSADTVTVLERAITEVGHFALYCQNGSNTKLYQTLIHNTKSAEENAKDNKDTGTRTTDADEQSQGIRRKSYHRVYLGDLQIQIQLLSVQLQKLNITSLDSKDVALYCLNESNTNIYQTLIHNTKSAEENANDNKVYLGDLQILKQLLSVQLQKLNITSLDSKDFALYCSNESNTNIYQTLIYNTKSAEENANDNKDTGTRTTDADEHLEDTWGNVLSLRRSADTETVVEPAITEVKHNTSLNSKDFALYCLNESKTNIYQTLIHNTKSAEENAKDNKGTGSCTTDADENSEHHGEKVLSSRDNAVNEKQRKLFDLFLFALLLFMTGMGNYKLSTYMITYKHYTIQQLILNNIEKIDSEWTTVDTYLFKKSSIFDNWHVPFHNGQVLNNQDYHTTFLLASERGYLKTVQLCIARGAPISDKDSQGWTALMLAVKNRHVDVVSLLLKSNASVNEKDTQGITALMLASYFGHSDLVHILVEFQANVNDGNVAGWSALMIASQYGHIEIVNFLLNNGANIHHRNIYNNNAVSIASYFGQIEILTLLLNAQQNVNHIGFNGWSYLQIACVSGQTDSVNTLIKLGADVNRKDGDNWTALMLASYNGHEDIVKILIKANASVNEKCIKGWSALMFASYREHAQIVQMLLSSGASVNEKDIVERTALMLASYKGNTQIVEILLASGATVNEKTLTGEIALLMASKNEIVKSLLNFGASVDGINIRGLNVFHPDHDAINITMLVLELGCSLYRGYINGDVALVRSILHGNLDMVEYLLENGINPNKTMPVVLAATENNHYEIVKYFVKMGFSVNDTYDGFTAVMCASLNGNQTILNFLVQNGASVNDRNNDKWTALMMASQNGHIDVVKSLLNYGALVNETNIEGFTALMIASHNGHVEVVRTLLKANIAADVQSKGGFTALVIASYFGHTEIVKVLIEFNASVNCKSRLGETALMTSSENGNVEITTILLDSGALVDAVDNNGSTALMIASQFGNVEVINTLLKYGASVSVVREDGFSPLMLASYNRKVETVKRLLEAGALQTNNRTEWKSFHIALIHGHLDVWL